MPKHSDRTPRFEVTDRGSDRQAVRERLGIPDRESTRGHRPAADQPISPGSASRATRSRCETVAFARRPRRRRTCRPGCRRTRSARARRRAQPSEADRQRELRQLCGVAGDGQLAERQVRRGQPRSPPLRGLRQRRRHRTRADELACALFGADHAYAQPHSGIDANLVAFWAVLSQRVECTGPRPPSACGTSTTSLTSDWERAASGARQPDAARHVAGSWRPPHSRLPAEHLRQALPPPLLRGRPRDRRSSTTTRSDAGPTR